MTTGYILRYATGVFLAAIVAAVPVDQPPDNMTISIFSENLEIGNNVEQRRGNLDHMAHNPLRKSVQDSGLLHFEWNEDGDLIDKSSTKIDVSDVRNGRNVAAVPVDQPSDIMTISILSENLETGYNVGQRRGDLDDMANNPLRNSVQDSGSIDRNEDDNLIDKSSTKIDTDVINLIDTSGTKFDTDVTTVSDVRPLRAGKSKDHPKSTMLGDSQKRMRNQRNVKGQSEADSKPREGDADRQERVETSTPPPNTPSQDTVGRHTHDTTTATTSTQVLNNVNSSSVSRSSLGNMDNEMSLRNKRAECPRGPPGLDKCIPCTHERPDKYFHRDIGTGYICMCDTCTPTMYQVTPCRCTVNRKVAVQPTCTFAILGETYMPHPNSCSEPLVCTSTCPGNLIIVIKCTLDADAVCGCDVNMELTGPTTCTDKPRCGIGYQSVEVYNPANPNYPTYTCEACEDGHIQPFNNSLQKCYPRPSPPEKLVKSTETVPNGGEKGTIAPTVLPRDVLTNGLSTIPVKQKPSISQKIDSQVPHTDFPHDVLHGYKTAVIVLIVILTVVLLLAIAFICHVCKDKCRNADGQQNVIYNGRDVLFNGAHDNCDAV